MVVGVALAVAFSAGPQPSMADEPMFAYLLNDKPINNYIYTGDYNDTYWNVTDGRLRPNSSAIDGIGTLYAPAFMSANWTNVTITESQITDLVHTTDTNATTECSDAQALLGNGTCIDTDDMLTAETDPLWQGNWSGYNKDEWDTAATNLGTITDDSGNFTGLNLSGEGLVGYWGFESGSGTTAYDSSNYGNDGVIDGPSWTFGKYGNGLDLDGTNDFVDVGQPNELNFVDGNSFSLVTWFKTEESGSLIAKRNDTYAQYQLYVNSNKLFVRGGSEYGYADYVVTDGNWHQGVAVINSTGWVEIYVDGLKRDWIDSSGTRPFSFVEYDINVGLGSRWGVYPSPSFLFNGTIDEVRIYNRTLSDTEIRTLYLLGRPDQTPVQSGGLTGNYTVGDCWQAFRKGIMYQTNCTAA